MQPRTIKWILIAAVCLLATAIVLKYVRAVPIDRLAERYARALCDKDADLLARYVPKYELDKLGMSREQARTVIREIVIPKLKGVEFVGVEDRINQAGGMSGVAFYIVRVGPVNTIQMSAELQLSDEGPIRRLRSLLNDAWKIQFMRNNPGATEREIAFGPIREGIIADRAALENLGFSGFVKNDESKPVESFDDALDRIKTRGNAARSIKIVRDANGETKVVRE